MGNLGQDLKLLAHAPHSKSISDTGYCGSVLLVLGSYHLQYEDSSLCWLHAMADRRPSSVKVLGIVRRTSTMSVRLCYVESIEGCFTMLY